MEEVLRLYAEPYDSKRPKVNFDETSRQLISEPREPLPPAPKRPERYDYEYKREGTRNLFMFVEPQAGWRHVEVTERRTKQDFAHQMKWLVDERYPDAEVIRVILDNLNTLGQDRSTKPSRRKKRFGSGTSWNSITRLNMALGSIWPK
jgi:DDE superfamily endonuclease